jgi:hypothetical protein
MPKRAFPQSHRERLVVECDLYSVQYTQAKPSPASGVSTHKNRLFPFDAQRTPCRSNCASLRHLPWVAVRMACSMRQRRSLGQPTWASTRTSERTGASAADSKPRRRPRLLHMVNSPFPWYLAPDDNVRVNYVSALVADWIGHRHGTFSAVGTDIVVNQ